MSKYSIYATKEDYAKAYKEIEELEAKSKTPLDWKKIKRANLDNLCVVIDILKRKVSNKVLKTKVQQREISVVKCSNGIVELDKYYYNSSQSLKISICSFLGDTITSLEKKIRSGAYSLSALNL